MTKYLEREETKFCPACGERKPRREFYVLKNGLSSRCKPCAKKRAATNYQRRGAS